MSAITISGGSVVCAVADGCRFGYSLVDTPLLLYVSPSSGNSGTVLTLIGHSFSLTPDDNSVHIGEKPCAVTSSLIDTSSTITSSINAACPVTSCTSPRSLVRLLCELPPNTAFLPHVVRVAVAGLGYSPTLEGATVTYSVRLQSVSPQAGSIAGGTQVTLIGDGFSNRLGDLDVALGGAPCRAVTTNYSHIVCISAAVGAAGSAAVSLKVRGVTAACDSECTFAYDQAYTPSLDVANVTVKGEPFPFLHRS